MEFNLERASDLFDKGHFASLSRARGLDLAPVRSLQPAALRVLIAHASVYTGKLDLALELAQSITEEDAATQAHARIVIGLIRKRQGNVEAACAEFQQASRLAKRSGDDIQLAWAQAHLFRVLSDGYPEQHLTPLLADVRKVVSSSGDPHVTAYLRDAVAVMETQKGRTDEAARHLNVARSLLTLRPNAWLEQLIALNASTVALVDRDPEAFSKYSAEARKLTQLTGHAKSDAAMEANDAYFALLTGAFDRAEVRVQRVLDSRVSQIVKLAALETLARMRLAFGRLEECEEVLERLESLRRRPFAMSYVFRGAATVRVKLLLRQGNWKAAAELAKSELAEVAKVNDSASLVTLKVLRAAALCHTNDMAECCRELLQAALAGATSFREHQAEYFNACGRILSHVGYEASSFEERSLRIWTEHRNRCGALEAATLQGAYVTNANEANRLLEEHPKREVSFRDSTDKAIAIDHMAAAFDLAYNPKLLGDELATAIRICDLSANVNVVESNSVANTDSIALSLKDEGTKKLKLVCDMPTDPMKAILLADILRLAKSALALERFRRAERNRAALWPAEPVEQQAGALFISEEMRALLATAQRIAPTNVPVLITGETGTGKEVLARTIHAYSTRAKAIFLPFNCTSTPRDMLDSQLFGHRRGAFTGAIESFQGVIRGAAGGTLFLDEIGDTTLEVQPKLLRFLESSEVHPLGDTQPTRVDVRVIVATNADLDALVAQGRFREDLFYRLNIVPLHVPPLRARRVEIPALANHYLQKYAHESNKGDLRLAEETMEYLVLYRWPGNVRQLANEMRKLAALAEPGAVLMPEHLSAPIAASRRTIPASERGLDPTEIVVRIDQPMTAAVHHLERAMILHALRKCGGRVEETAALLGLSRKGLYLKRQRLGIEPLERIVAAEVA